MNSTATNTAAAQTTDLPVIKSHIASKTLDQLSQSGAGADVATNYTGTVLEIRPRDLQALVDRPQLVRQQIDGHADKIAEVTENGGRFERAEYRKMQDYKRTLPDFSRAKEITVLKALHADTENLEKVVKAPDQYVQLTLKDEGTQKGRVVTTADGKTVRDGVWVARDKEGNFQEMAEFKEGKLHGNMKQYETDGRGNRHIVASAAFDAGTPVHKHYRYNGEGLVTQRITYEEGKVTANEAVDPEQTKLRQAEFVSKREDQKLQRSMGPSL